MTGVERHTRGNAVAIGETAFLRKLLGFTAFSSVNGHAQTAVLISVDRKPEYLLPPPSAVRID